MATQTAALRLTCALLEAGEAVDTAIAAMGLKVMSAEGTPDGFRRSAKEKLNWLSTKWPLQVEVMGRPVGESVVIEVLAGASSSVGAKRDVERKLAQFVELIKTHSRDSGETSAT